MHGFRGKALYLCITSRDCLKKNGSEMVDFGIWPQEGTLKINDGHQLNVRFLGGLLRNFEAFSRPVMATSPCFKWILTDSTAGEGPAKPIRSVLKVRKIIHSS